MGFLQRVESKNPKPNDVMAYTFSSMQNSETPNSPSRHRRKTQVCENDELNPFSVESRMSIPSEGEATA